MKIDILCHDGSPIGVTREDIYGSENRVGLGGAEYALITMCDEWHRRGYDVVVYNDPLNPHGSPWEHRPIRSFEAKSNRDVLVVFRAPNPLAIPASGLKVWWSCDQYTRADADFRKFSPYVHKIVVISQRHREYFEQTYGIMHSIPIDLPVRICDLEEEVQKVPNKIIFTSVPDRGLPVLHGCWSLIKSEIPDVNLTITSDYRLWGIHEPMNEMHRIRWLMEDGVRFLGAVKRKQLIAEQLSSQVLAYPSTYDELFCVSVAEAQACGVYPVTSDMGALPTTNMGMVVPLGDDFKTRFASSIVDILRNPNLSSLQQEVKEKAFKRFSPAMIADEWEEKIFKT